VRRYAPWTLTEIIVAFALVIILAVSLALLTGCGPMVKKKVYAKETSLYNGTTNHYLVADDGTSAFVTRTQYFRTTVGDSVLSYWSEN